MTRIDVKSWIDPKKAAAAVAMSGALGVCALGLSAGVANADSVAPKTSPVVWSQDDGDGYWGHGHGHWGRGGEGWGPGWGPGPGYWGPGAAGWAPCAAGAIGVASGQVCI